MKILTILLIFCFTVFVFIQIGFEKRSDTKYLLWFEMKDTFLFCDLKSTMGTFCYLFAINECLYLFNLSST